MDIRRDNGSLILHWYDYIEHINYDSIYRSYYRIEPARITTNMMIEHLGGILPMVPYFAMHRVVDALFVSIGITVVILLAFGFIKNYVTVKTKRSGFYGAVQTLLVGVLAAGTSYGIVYGIDHSMS